MMKDVLDFAKPQELRMIPQDIHPILEEAAERFRGEFEKAGISLHKEFARTLPSLAVDSERMSQVLVNLLQNAVYASAGIDGPRITIRTFGLKSEEAVRIEVADNGSGIAENHLPRVFDPFFTGRSAGTGLGLTVVKKIVEAHHGRVGIESPPGKGTTVWIELPEPPKRSGARSSVN
jgi:two-component system NtrC family sensor kinase